MVDQLRQSYGMTLKLEVRIFTVEILAHVIVQTDLLLESRLRQQRPGKCFCDRRDGIHTIRCRSARFNLIPSPKVICIALAILNHANGEPDRLRRTLEEFLGGEIDDRTDLGWLGAFFLRSA